MRLLIRPLTAVVLLLGLHSPLSAEWDLTTGGVVGFPLLTGIYNGVYPGFQVQWAPEGGPWAFEVGYAFRSLDPYWFDHSSDLWSGPSTGAIPADWPFYQTTHIFNPGVLWLWHRGPVTIRTGVGALLQLILGTEALDYYPDFRDAFERNQSKAKLVLGNSWKVGVEVEPFSGFFLGTDLVYEVADWQDFLRDMPENLWIYSRQHAHAEIRLGVKL